MFAHPATMAGRARRVNGDSIAIGMQAQIGRMRCGPRRCVWAQVEALRPTRLESACLISSMADFHALIVPKGSSDNHSTYTVHALLFAGFRALIVKLPARSCSMRTW